MKLVWDKVGERFYETGCDHGVLYPIQTGGKYNKGVAWNGLSAVSYTHLDVYKRQIHMCLFGGINWIPLMKLEIQICG